MSNQTSEQEDQTDRKILYICSQPPFSSLLGKDCIDGAMTSAAFGLNVSLLFRGEGIWQLLGNKLSSKHLKDHSAVIEGLELYDIKQVYICQKSLNDRGVAATDLMPPLNTRAEIISSAEVAQLLQSQNTILNY